VNPSLQASRTQFEMARVQCTQDTKNLAAWTPILRSYVPGLLAACDHASKRANTIVATALAAHMLSDHTDPQKDAAEAADWFGDAERLLSHGRPVRRDEARDHHIKVNDLEADPELQDLVLSVHHASMLTLAGTPTAKLVETIASGHGCRCRCSSSFRLQCPLEVTRPRHRQVRWSRPQPPVREAETGRRAVARSAAGNSNARRQRGLALPARPARPPVYAGAVAPRCPDPLTFAPVVIPQAAANAACFAREAVVHPGPIAHERLVAVGLVRSGPVVTIALEECDRRAVGAVPQNRAGEFGRRHKLEVGNTWRRGRHGWPLFSGP